MTRGSGEAAAGSRMRRGGWRRGRRTRGGGAAAVADDASRRRSARVMSDDATEDETRRADSWEGTTWISRPSRSLMEVSGSRSLSAQCHHHRVVGFRCRHGRGDAGSRWTMKWHGGTFMLTHQLETLWYGTISGEHMEKGADGIFRRGGMTPARSTGPRSVFPKSAGSWRLAFSSKHTQKLDLVQFEHF